MYTEKGKALGKAVAEARAEYAEADREYQEASKLAIDTDFKNADTAHGVLIAARKSGRIMAAYSKAMKEWADYLHKESARSRKDE